MSDPIHCPDCGAELPTGLPLGLCSRCALTGALELSDAAEPASARPPVIRTLPRSFGDYELLEEIARGGMGIVFKARQVSLGRLVAVKLLLRGEYASEEFIHRFRIEASAAAALQHPNIVAIHEVGLHEGQHYFAMDLVDGPNLAQLLRDGPLPARRAAGYVKTIAEAIHFAHSRRILHRDLKPSNVLIDSNDQPRVTDFGLAKQLVGMGSTQCHAISQEVTDAVEHVSTDSLTLSGQVLGSPAYMPPEQASGQRERVRVTSDVYSLGAILYHALTGRPPFTGQSVADTLKQVESMDPIAPRVLNPGVPQDIATICLKCLEKEPERRYQTAKELAEELNRFLNVEAIRARAVSHPEKVWRWCRRNPVIAALAVSVLLTASIGLVGWLIARERAQLARQAEFKRLEMLYANDSFLVSQALLDTNLNNAADLLRGLQTAIDHWPTNTALWRSKAVVLKRTGALEDALAHISKAIELASTNGEKLLLIEMLLFRRDLLREMNRGAEAGLDERRARGLPYQHLLTNELPDYQRAAEVSVEFGATNRDSGLYFIEGDDSKHVPSIIDGSQSWFFEGGANFARFFIDPTFKWNLGSDVVIRFEYQIPNRNKMALQYDGPHGEYSKAVEVRRDYREAGSSWRVIEFRVRDARFQNSHNSGADFRIHNNESRFYLRRVTLARYQQKHMMRPRDPSTSSNLVDLTVFYNASLRLFMPGGDPDAATNVLRAVQQTTGVNFDARGYILLYRGGEESTETNTSPASVTGIPIGRRLSGLHFLQAASYLESTGRRIGSYVMHMSDGSRQELAMVYGRNVVSDGDYRNVPEAELAWDAEGIGRPGTRVRMFKVTWVNPDPTVAVTSLDFFSTGSKSAPILLGITIEP